MRLKVYHAPNIGAAMAMVRDELGPDALILASRSVDDGIEVTAAQETPLTSAPPPSAPPSPPPPFSGRGTHQLPIAPTEIARAGTLRWHGVPADLAVRLGRGDLAEALRANVSFGTLPKRLGDPPILVVGPPGAGKTLTIAKLATRFKMSGSPSMVITSDGRRAGAAEQLAAFTRLLGLTLIVADNANQLARALARRIDGEPVLVDMPGLNPFDAQDRSFVSECQAATGAVIVLVVPVGLDPGDALDMAAAYVELGAKLLIVTRLDQSRRLGGVLAAASAGLALTDAGIGPGVANGLTALTADFLAERLVVASPSPVVPPLEFPLARLARSGSEQPRPLS